MSLLKTLITERNEIAENSATEFTYVDKANIKKQLTAGAKDLDQKWRSATQLVNKAFETTSNDIPSPSHKANYQFYIDMLSFGVRELAKYRGPNGDWRITTAIAENTNSFKIDMITADSCDQQLDEGYADDCIVSNISIHSLVSNHIEKTISKHINIVVESVTDDNINVNFYHNDIKFPYHLKLTVL